MAPILTLPNPFRRSEIPGNTSMYASTELAKARVVALVENVVKSVLSEINSNLYLYQNIDLALERLITVPTLDDGEEMVSSNTINKIGEATIDMINATLVEVGGLYTHLPSAHLIHTIENPYKSPHAKVVAALETQIGTRVSEREARAKVLSNVKEIIQAKIRLLKKQEYVSNFTLRLISSQTLLFQTNDHGEVSMNEVLNVAAISIDSINASLTYLAQCLAGDAASATSAIPITTTASSQSL